MVYLQAKPTLSRTVLRIFCHISWLALVYSHGLLGEKCVTSVQGASLLKHSYKSLLVSDMFVC